MSDDQVRDLLTRALPDPSPLSASEQQIMLGRGRRALRRRKLMTAGAGLMGVAVLVAGIAVAPALVGGGGGVGAQQQPGAPSESPSGSPSASPSASASAAVDGKLPSTNPPSITLHADAETAQRLTTALTAATGQALPGSTFTPTPRRNWPAWQVRPQTDYYLGGAWVTDAAGSGSVDVVVEWRHLWDCRPEYTSGTNGLVSCEDGVAPSGEHWNFQILNDAGNGRPNILMYQLSLERADGTHIQINAQNTTTVKDANGSVSRSTPPMTKQQMIAVALAPGLDVGP